MEHLLQHTPLAAAELLVLYSIQFVLVFLDNDMMVQI